MRLGLYKEGNPLPQTIVKFTTYDKPAVVILHTKMSLPSNSMLQIQRALIKILTEENSELKSSLQLVTDEKAKERAEFEAILMEKQRTIDQYGKRAVQQDELVHKLKISLVDCEIEQLDLIQNNVELRQSIQQFKNELKVFEADLAGKQREIDECLVPRIQQLETENSYLQNTQSDAESATEHKITPDVLIDQALAKLQEAIDLVAEYETGTGATPESKQSTGKKIKKYWFVKKGTTSKPSGEPSNKTFLNELDYTGCVIIERAKSLKEVAKQIKAQGKHLKKKATQLPQIPVTVPYCH